MTLLTNTPLVRNVAFWLVVVAQVAILLAFIGVREYRLQTGMEVVLQTVPVDPRSLLQGDYVILRYEIGRLPVYLGTLELGETVYVIMEKRDETWHVLSHQVEKPESRTDRLFIKGTVESGDWLDFGIGNYFVPESRGSEIERAGDVKVKVTIDASGNAAIKEVYVDGVPFSTGERLGAAAVSVSTEQPFPTATLTQKIVPTSGPAATAMTMP